MLELSPRTVRRGLHCVDDGSGPKTDLERTSTRLGIADIGTSVQFKSRAKTVSPPTGSTDGVVRGVEYPGPSGWDPGPLFKPTPVTRSRSPRDPTYSSVRDVSPGHKSVESGSDCPRQCPRRDLPWYPGDGGRVETVGSGNSTGDAPTPTVTDLNHLVKPGLLDAFHDHYDRRVSAARHGNDAR